MDERTTQRINREGTAAKDARALLRRRLITTTLFFCALLLVAYVSYGTLKQPPTHFPLKTPIKIEEGSTLSAAAKTLKRAGAIRSPSVFTHTIKTRFEDRPIQAGTYYFTEVLDAEGVASALVDGTSMLPPLQIVIPEGLRIDQIDELVASQHDSISLGDFARAAGSGEGYLFPDTYYVPEEYTAAELVELMQETFFERLTEIESELASSPYEISDIITMASLLEREANSEESKKLVAGILWKRLENDMPLQVDAVFEYIYKRSAADLTSEDLLIDSPYNTYKNRGLPPTPIVNPGLESIRAALDPTASDYWYYITAPDGTFYYAKTFEEHKANIARYLR